MKKEDEERESIQKRILYVEDNEDTAEGVKAILTHAGFKAELAFCGKDGVKKAISGLFDLVLIDIMLPDISGWDVFTKLNGKVKSKVAFLYIRQSP